MEKKSKFHTSLSVKKATSFDRMVKIRQSFLTERYSNYGKQEHFFEHLGFVNGCEVINNASSSDVDSTWFAMNQVANEMVWIMGGAASKIDFSVLKEIVCKKVKAIVFTGPLNVQLHDLFVNKEGSIIVNAKDYSEAIQLAVKLAKNKETILFSPSCPSYDSFENYEKRGEDFKRKFEAFVKELSWKN
jgi:UDP-N-acetylmuramoylalanine--D-glutamate ligase